MITIAAHTSMLVSRDLPRKRGADIGLARRAPADLRMSLSGGLRDASPRPPTAPPAVACPKTSERRPIPLWTGSEMAGSARSGTRCRMAPRGLQEPRWRANGTR